MKYSYHLEGNPVAYIKSTEGSVWSDYKKGHVVHRISLTNQHKEKPPLSGKLHVEYHFVFDEKAFKKAEAMLAKRYARQCTLLAHVRYIEEIAKEILFNPINVVSLKASMEYGLEPGTTFNITIK